MLHIAICDDNIILVEALEKMIRLQAEQLQNACICDVFYDGADFVKAYEQQAYDLIFLDIEMEKMDGIAVGKHLRENCEDNRTQIVYISSKEQYAMELFQNRPMDFLVKPILNTDVSRILQLASKLSAQRIEKILEVQSQGNFYKISHADILYLCSSGREISIYTKQGKIISKGKLSDWIRKVDNEDFFLIHKSFFVNYQHIARVQYENVVLDDGTILPISQANRKAVREFLYLKSQKKGG